MYVPLHSSTLCYLKGQAGGETECPGLMEIKLQRRDLYYNDIINISMTEVIAHKCASLRVLWTKVFIYFNLPLEAALMIYHMNVFSSYCAPFKQYPNETYRMTFVMFCYVASFRCIANCRNNDTGQNV